MTSKARKFSSCRAAVDYVGKAGQLALSEPNLDPKLGTLKVERQLDGSFEAMIDVKFCVAPAKSMITMPDFSWPKMTKAEGKALQEFIDALRAHENGHFQVVEQVARKWSTEVGATGSTEADAKANLQSELDKRRTSAQEELDSQARDGGAYDTATDHGRSQSKGPDNNFPGGADVRLNCP